MLASSSSAAAAAAATANPAPAAAQRKKAKNKKRSKAGKVGKVAAVSDVSADTANSQWHRVGTAASQPSAAPVLKKSSATSSGSSFESCAQPPLARFVHGWTAVPPSAVSSAAVGVGGGDQQPSDARVLGHVLLFGGTGETMDFGDTHVLSLVCA